MARLTPWASCLCAVVLACLAEGGSSDVADVTAQADLPSGLRKATPTAGGEAPAGVTLAVNVSKFTQGFNATRDAFDGVAHKVLQSDVMFVLCFFMLLQWHVLVNFEEVKKDGVVVLKQRDLTPYRTKLLRTFGTAIIVYQVYYNRSLHKIIPHTKVNPFWSNCLFLFFERVIVEQTVTPLCRAYMGRPCKNIMSKMSKKKGRGQDVGYEMQNVYMDIVTRKFRRAILTFVAQTGLMAYYTYYLNTDADTHDLKAVSQLKWFIAVCVVEVAGDDEMGAELDFGYWIHMWGKARDAKILGNTRALVWFLRVPFGVEIIVRATFDVIINGFFRCVVLGTAPIMLAVEAPLDFLKDVTAVFFVIKLDDFADAISINDYDILADGFKAKENTGSEITPALPFEQHSIARTLQRGFTHGFGHEISVQDISLPLLNVDGLNSTQEKR